MIITQSSKDENTEEKFSPAKVLGEISKRGKYYKSSDGELVVVFQYNGCFKTYDLNENRSSNEKLFRTIYKEETGLIPPNELLTSMIKQLCAETEIKGEVIDIFVRVGWTEDAVYIDMVDEASSFIEITAISINVYSNKECPVVFRRRTGQLPLPKPKFGKSIKLLKRFLNYSDKDDFKLLVGWLLGCFSKGPYAHLALHGTHGSAKSCTAKYLCDVIDPNIKRFRPFPKKHHEIAIAARSNYILTFDNMSTLYREQSDTLCRLSTGDDFGKRTLYTDFDESTLHLRRPAVINGIEDLAINGDLLERSIVMNLPEISSDDRKDENEMNKEFKRLHPFILGAFLKGIQSALHNISTTELSVAPRLIDFVKFVEAGSEAFNWKQDSFSMAFIDNQDGSAQIELDASPVGQALWQMMDKIQEKGTGCWVGTATELLEELILYRTEKVKKWPGSANHLSSQLRRLSPVLRKNGIIVNFSRDNKGHKLIDLEWEDDIEWDCEYEDEGPTLKY
ncbi:MAG: hypothetical protein P9L92_14655 [Candidatus Electryonea clarkiae]|nr:hypothetical protein [Candidatus Electryonea clarkiae]